MGVRNNLFKPFSTSIVSVGRVSPFYSTSKFGIFCHVVFNYKLKQFLTTVPWHHVLCTSLAVYIIHITTVTIMTVT